MNGLNAQRGTCIARPAVSVVVPAYNAEAYIGATLSSVLKQSFEQFEVIVVDDRSTDATPVLVQALAKNDARLHLITLENNFGTPAGPRNVGVREARGDWIAFLDSDDIWHPDKLKLQLDMLSRSAARLCSSQMVDFTDERELVFRPAEHLTTQDITFLSLLVKPRVPTSSVINWRAPLRTTA